MPLRKGTPMPELSGATEWINSEVTREELIGNPTLIHFFAKSCHICHENMPTINAWRDRYAATGLRVVGIHMPREEQDTVMDAVRLDIAQMGIVEPCAIDNQHAIGERFQNELWPAYFLFDADGNLQGRAAGYAGLKLIEGPLMRLIDAPQSA